VRIRISRSSFFSIAVDYCRSEGYTIDDLKNAFMNNLPDGENLLWMLDMLENLKNVPKIKRLGLAT